MRDALGNESKTYYDAHSNPIATIDPEGHLTSRLYDSLDRLIDEVMPEGIAVHRDYDLASRLTTYRDALGNATTYDYDALGRNTTVSYPDGTAMASEYDPAGNRTGWTDPRGNAVAQVFDAAGRLTGRTAELAAGVPGPTSESFSYDSLSRLTQAIRGGAIAASSATSVQGPQARMAQDTTGGVTSTRTYDSLSRLMTDTTGGMTLGYSHDDVGNVSAEDLPSQLVVQRSYDALNRLSSVGRLAGGSFVPSASYTYQGPARLAGKQAHGLTSSRIRDAAGRLLQETAVTPAGDVAFGEKLAWSARSLKVAQERTDLDGLGQAFRYDGAGQLAAVAALLAPTEQVANNSQPPVAQLAATLSLQTQEYDAARNLRSRSYVARGVEQRLETPPETASGRNRPASVDGVPLSYDASGNLIAKGDMGFEYDFHNRLIRATKAGQEIARYTYDAFGRRIEKEVGGVTQTTVWSGWQPVETYRDGVLAERQVYGRGIDEVTELERDLDGDGTLETQATPWYDSTGNPVLLADSAGKVIERYSYTPFGEQEIRVDATPPEIEQVRVRDDEVWLELSEEVQREVFREQVENGAVLLEDTSQEPPVPLEIHLLDAAASTGGASSASAAQAVAQSGASTVSGHGRTPDAERFRDPSRRRLILEVTSPPAADTAAPPRRTGGSPEGPLPQRGDRRLRAGLRLADQRHRGLRLGTARGARRRPARRPPGADLQRGAGPGDDHRHRHRHPAHLDPVGRPLHPDQRRDPRRRRVHSGRGHHPHRPRRHRAAGDLHPRLHRRRRRPERRLLRPPRPAPHRDLGGRQPVCLPRLAEGRRDRAAVRAEPVLRPGDGAVHHRGPDGVSRWHESVCIRWQRSCQRN